MGKVSWNFGMKRSHGWSKNHVYSYGQMQGNN